jgi:hypothetical protein
MGYGKKTDLYPLSSSPGVGSYTLRKDFKFINSGKMSLGRDVITL